MPHAECSKPTILLLGTGHWSNPGLDYRQNEFDDMLAPRRQREIEECLQSLVAFGPSKIALERQRHDESWLNADYKAYRDGTLALTANERHQIGFRLAAMVGHNQVHGIDWHHPSQPIGWDDAIEFAQRNDQEHLIPFFTNDNDVADKDHASIVQAHVRELLLASSDPHRLGRNHQVYMDLALVGMNDDYIGADVILRWYERNMKIFVNISRLATSPTDRILVLIGGGHLPLLTHFIEGSRRFTLEPASDYLT